MNIKVSDLKKFKSYSSHIKGAGILPIQDYLKFGKGMIQKEVTASFIKFDCEDATEELLVEEKVLYDLVSQTPSDYITIVAKDGKTIISDHRDKIPMQVPETGLFVDIPLISLEKHDLSPDFLKALGCAAITCTAMGTIPDKYMFVMVGNKCVTSIAVSYGYCRVVEEDITMVLDKNSASFVSKTGAKKCSISDSHHVFYTEEAVIGFAKSVIGYGDLGKLLRADAGDLTFTCSNSDLTSYNSLSMSLFKFPKVTMTQKGTLETYDPLKDIAHDREVSNLKPFEEFTYLPAAMNTILQALDTEELDVYQKSNMLIIKSRDTNAIAAIGKVQKI